MHLENFSVYDIDADIQNSKAQLKRRKSKDDKDLLCLFDPTSFDGIGRDWNLTEAQMSNGDLLLYAEKVTGIR